MFFTGKQNKKSTFERCFAPHLEGLYRFAYRLSQSRADAEDLVQDLVVKVYKGSTDISKLNNPRTWLSKVMYRLFIDKYRQNSRAPVLQLITEESEDHSSIIENWEYDTLNLENLTEQQQFIELIENAMSKLNEEHRTLINMFEIEGYSLAEISEILDVPMGTLKSRLHRARKRLRILLEEGPNWAELTCLKQGTMK
jgi:RNA polymerase sigma-70 factor (ECF subfamily)